MSMSGLNDANKTEKWLFANLKLDEQTSIKDVLLAIYDEEKDKVIVHYKKR